MMNIQHTLKDRFTVQGVALHSGKVTTVSLFPAPTGHGITFKRTDKDNAVVVPAKFENVHETKLATTLGQGDSAVSTIEHMMAAFFGLGLTNVRVEVDGPEVPILDGSAKVWVEKIREAGLVNQKLGSTVLVIKKPVWIEIGDKKALAEPSDRFEVHYEVDWNHPVIGKQTHSYIEGKDSFDEVCSARTFGFLKDAEALKKMGLAQGGSLENAIVLDDEKVLNPEGLRFENEFARHKLLDSLGDFMLAGMQIQAKITVKKGGHEIHRNLIQHIFMHRDSYALVHDVKEESDLYFFPRSRKREDFSDLDMQIAQSLQKAFAG